MTLEEWTERLVAASRSGVFLDLAPGEDADPADADRWDAARRVPANAIRDALLSVSLRPDPRGLRLYGADVVGVLDLGRASLPCQLRLSHCRFTDPIRMDGASLPALSLDGSRVPSLDLDGAHITGSVLLNDGFTATGPVRLLSAEVGGQLNLTGATLTDPDNVTLCLENAQVTGSVFLNEGFTATGEVRALGVQIGGQLVMNGATLTNPDGVALGLDNARLAGNVFLTDGFSAKGTVRALGAQLQGALDLRGAALERLALDFASIALLSVEARPVARLSAVGWRLGEIRGTLNRPRMAIDWLSRVDDEDFAVQPWHELAAVYERHGRPADAKRLRFQAARRVTRRAPWWSKPVRWLYGAFAGYGYYPLLAGFWLILAALLSGTVTALYGAGPVEPGFNPWLYGAAVVVPPAAAIVPSSWTVTDPLWLAWLNIALKAFGWLQTGILLAGLTGLLKKS